jgi:hypothetical protein
MAGPDDPLGRRALFSDPPASDPAPDPAPDPGPGAPDRAPAGGGRRALFSRAEPAGADEPAAAAPAGFGHVVVRCSSCQQHTPLPFLALGRQLIPSAWWPLRAYPILMRCPGCHRLSWCRIDWAAVFRL